MAVKLVHSIDDDIPAEVDPDMRDRNTELHSLLYLEINHPCFLFKLTKAFVFIFRTLHLSYFLVCHIMNHCLAEE